MDRLNKTQLNKIKAELLSRVLLLTDFQNELKERVLQFRAIYGDKGTCCLGQGINIETENYEVIVHFPYTTYMQSNVTDKAIKPLMDRIQDFITRQYPELHLYVRHEVGNMD